MITQILLMQTFIMFILMILGLILSKTGLLTEHGSKDMANILLYAVIPCVIIRSYITDFTMEKLYGLLMSAVLAVAVEKYGAIKGGTLALWRIIRCNPFSKGGYDPVP